MQQYLRGTKIVCSLLSKDFSSMASVTVLLVFAVRIRHSSVGETVEMCQLSRVISIAFSRARPCALKVSKIMMRTSSSVLYWERVSAFQLIPLVLVFHARCSHMRVVSKVKKCETCVTDLGCGVENRIMLGASCRNYSNVCLTRSIEVNSVNTS